MGFLEGFEYSQLHVMVVPFPGQGHINPMLQFAKRLASKNVGVTFVTTEANHRRMLQSQGATSGASKKPEEVRFETIPDGLTSDSERSDVVVLSAMLYNIGGEKLENLIERLNAQGTQISCIVQDSFMGWVPEVAKKFKIPSAFFWTQSCAVYSIFHHFVHGKLAIQLEETQNTEAGIEIPGLPPLSVSDLPSLVQPSSPDGHVLRVVMDQFMSLPEATWVLGNSFNELESEEINSMKSTAPIRTVGPLIPSAFLDGQSPRDTDSVPHMWKTVNCMDWLNTKQPASVVYVSFGSLAVLSKEQTHEIALGLKASGYSFIWVIRPSSSKGEIHSDEDLPEGFQNESSEQGLVVPWCPQLEVLSHASVGAFMTHCGWNSTLEGLSLGVPMLAVPLWSDQTTNSFYIAERWKTGLRLSKRSEDGLVGKDEVEKGIRTVMESERGIELRMNALRWKTLASEAMVEGGSSDKNIEEFVQEIAAKASSMSG
jgi:UDP:flavonoid glycosyltransferase YjiC (YdhE family)